MDSTGSTPSAIPLLSQPLWLSLSSETRAKLVQIFGLKRSGATETYMGRDSKVRVVSDGYTSEDLLLVTKERMQQILDTDSTDFYGMFDEILANIDAILNPKPPEDESSKLVNKEGGVVYESPVKKKSYYKPKNKTA